MTMCQFHQHFTRTFFVRKCFAQLFSSLVCYFLAQEYWRKSCLLYVDGIDTKVLQVTKKIIILQLSSKFILNPSHTLYVAFFLFCPINAVHWAWKRSGWKERESRIMMHKFSFNNRSPTENYLMRKIECGSLSRGWTLLFRLELKIPDEISADVWMRQPSVISSFNKKTRIDFPDSESEFCGDGIGTCRLRRRLRVHSIVRSKYLLP